MRLSSRPLLFNLSIGCSLRIGNIIRFLPSIRFLAWIRSNPIHLIHSSSNAKLSLVIYSMCVKNIPPSSINLDILRSCDNGNNGVCYLICCFFVVNVFIIVYFGLLLLVYYYHFKHGRNTPLLSLLSVAYHPRLDCIMQFNSSLQFDSLLGFDAFFVDSVAVIIILCSNQSYNDQSNND